MEKSEGEIQSDICTYLDSLSDVVYSVTNASSIRNIFRSHRKGATKTGWPDITGVLGPSGRFFAIECKTKRGKLSDQQSHILGMLQRRGALIIVGRSVNEVAKVIVEALYGSPALRDVR